MKNITGEKQKKEKTKEKVPIYSPLRLCCRCKSDPKSIYNVVSWLPPLWVATRSSQSHEDGGAADVAEVVAATPMVPPGSPNRSILAVKEQVRGFGVRRAMTLDL